MQQQISSAKTAAASRVLSDATVSITAVMARTKPLATVSMVMPKNIYEVLKLIHSKINLQQECRGSFIKKLGLNSVKKLNKDEKMLPEKLEPTGIHKLKIKICSSK